jgi:hypothetical protein
VAAYAESRIRVRDGDRVIEGVAWGHQCGGGEHSCAVEFADCAVDARREAEVVSVDDEAGRHSVILARWHENDGEAGMTYG